MSLSPVLKYMAKQAVDCCMAHSHHCLVTQKLHSTYFNVYYTRILLLDLTYGRTMILKFHENPPTTSWITALTNKQKNRRGWKHKLLPSCSGHNDYRLTGHWHLSLRRHDLKNTYTEVRFSTFFSEMEPGLQSQVTGSATLATSGRVTGQCVRLGHWPGFEF